MKTGRPWAKTETESVCKRQLPLGPPSPPRRARARQGPLKALSQFLFQLAEGGCRRGRFGMNHQIQWRKLSALRPSPVDLPKSSFEFDTNHCAADLAADGHTDARVAALVVNEIKR